MNMNHILNKKIILLLQVFYLFSLFILSNILNIYLSFAICSITNILSLALVLVNIKNKCSYKILLLISIVEIVLTILVYLLPEAGYIAPIQLF